MADEMLVYVRRPKLRSMVHVPTCPHAKRARQASPITAADAQDLVACRVCLGAMYEGQLLRHVGRMLP
jgi:hypothetical protein